MLELFFHPPVPQAVIFVNPFQGFFALSSGLEWCGVRFSVTTPVSVFGLRGFLLVPGGCWIFD